MHNKSHTFSDHFHGSDTYLLMLLHSCSPVALSCSSKPLRSPPTLFFSLPHSPFLLQKPVPFLLLKMFFSALYELYFWNRIPSPCEWAAPYARVPLFSNGLTVVLTMPVSSFAHILCWFLEKGQKWDAGWLLPFHRRCHAVIHFPTISFLMPSLKSVEKAHHWLSFYFFSFLLFSLFFIFFKKNKTK